MLKDISVNELSSWTNNFQQNTALPFVTRSALIELDELQAFVDAAKRQNAKAVRVYCIRLTTNETLYLPPDNTDGKLPEGCIWVEAGNGVTQGSFAMVPVDKISIDSNFIFSGNDIVQGNAITALIPGIDLKGTGHCPPGACETVKAPPPGDSDEG